MWVRGGGDTDPKKTSGSGCKEYACTENSGNSDKQDDGERNYYAHGNGDNDDCAELYADDDDYGDIDADDDQYNDSDAVNNGDGIGDKG